MWVSRIQVSGGFLDGVDLSFDKGLNVLIGGRGSGKTSVLELIRHAMNLAHANPAQERASRDFIKSVLGTGEVTLDLFDEASPVRLIVDGSGAGRRSDVRNAAIMVGQNELEAIASDPPSRLSLLDIRAGIDPAIEVPGSIARLTRRLHEIRALRAELKEQVTQIAEFSAQREVARSRETELLSAKQGGLDSERDALRGIEEQILRARRSRHQLSEYDDRLSILHENLDELSEQTAELRSLTVPEGFRSAAAEFDSKATDALSKFAAAIGTAEGLIAQAHEGHSHEEQSLLERSSPLKEQMAEAEAGLGQVSAEIRALNSQIESLESKGEERRQLKKEYRRVGEQRDTLLRSLESSMEELYEARTAVAEVVTGQLDNKAAIRVEHLSDSTRLEVFLLDALRGSGLQYKSIVERLVAAFLPHSLLIAVESSDVQTIASAIALQPERAARVVQTLDTPEYLGALAEMVLEDRADYLLRHGTELKNVEQLSTGQKCAVTLPILMTELDRALLLDQPEDHLDNAFLVDAVLPSLAKRKQHSAQTIVATHNANIPVLGDADRVIAMESDGRRGFVSAVGGLDDTSVVSRITSVMEGGKQAFTRRAKFYADHEQP